MITTTDMKDLMKTNNPVEVSSIDFHAHILPTCDHGSRNLETSLKQLKLASTAGVDVVCATPHFYPSKEDVDDFLARREQSFNMLASAVDADAPKVLLGAEVLVFAGMEKMPDLHKLCLQGTNILLLEMPFVAWDDAVVRTVEEILTCDRFTVVLAHADRYDPDDINYLLGLGALFQLNAESIANPFPKKHIRSWIDHESLVAIGSDIHGTDIGYKKWHRARRKLGADWHDIMSKNCSLIHSSQEKIVTSRI